MSVGEIESMAATHVFQREGARFEGRLLVDGESPTRFDEEKVWDNPDSHRFSPCIPQFGASESTAVYSNIDRKSGGHCFVDHDVIQTGCGFRL